MKHACNFVTIIDASSTPHFSYDPETNDASLLLTLSSGSDSDSFPSGLTGNLGDELTAAGESIGIEIQAMIIRFGKLHACFFSQLGQIDDTFIFDSY